MTPTQFDAIMSAIKSISDKIDAMGAKTQLEPQEAAQELPEGLPPLPPGTRYGGRLKDYEGRVVGYTCEPGYQWSALANWYGMKGCQDSEFDNWHIAIPI